jgi:signal peptidase I
MSGLEDHGPLQGDWPDKPAGAPPARHRRGFFRELPFLIVVALALALLVKTFLVQAFYIPSESMEPTLHGCDGCRGDRVLVNRLVYRFRHPRRGEVIVFVQHSNRPERSVVGKVANFFVEGLGVARPDNPDFIKRIIGLPGETLELKEGVVNITRVDGRKLRLTEPYVSSEKETRSFAPVKVPADEYFVMGDNRTHSADSRYGLGTIRRSDIVGKAFVKIWPPGRLGRLTGASYDGDTPVAGIVVIGWWLALRRRRRRRARRVELVDAA